MRRHRSKNVRWSVARPTSLAMISLERRVMMHVDPNDPTHHDEIPSDLGIFPVITADASGDAGTPTMAGASVPLTSVPALNSRPAATAKIYLDFTGDTTATWGSYAPGITPAYDTDGDTTTFSDAELTSIQQIFNRVAEKYSPFNINVTTVNPGTLTNKVALKVVIGGDGAWLGSQAGGVSYVGSFANSAPNTAFVFPKMLSNGYSKYVAEAAAHESGHAFGLQHQSTYDAAGNKTAEYAPANASGDAPIMGSSYTARRGLWWNGLSAVSSTSMQDDLSIISNTANGFGYRADDFGSTIAAASTLTLNGASVSTAGVIERTSDADVFSFTTAAGAVNFSATPSASGGMLDAKLDLRDAAGNVVASADNGLSESLTANVAAGTYFVTVSSHGGYGDIGQYSLSGTVVETPVVPPTPQPTVPAAPTGLLARSTSSTSVRLTWADHATDETGFKVYGSKDGGSTWQLLGTVAANVTTANHTGLRRNATWTYKVRAFNAVGDSADSNVASAKTALTAATTVPGDVNLDGVVDFADLVVVAQHYDTVGGATWADGDLNGDGNVDFTDLTTVSQNYDASLAAQSPENPDDWGTLTGDVGDAVTAATSSGVASAQVARSATPFSTRQIVRPHLARVVQRAGLRR